MPIITAIDRKSWRGKAADFFLYLILAGGAVLMIYPFLMMLTISASNEADSKTGSLWPKYLVDEDLLYRKYVATRYQSFQKFLGTAHLNRNYLTSYLKFEDLADQKKPVMTVAASEDGKTNTPVPVDAGSPHQKQRVRDWLEFSSSLPPTHIVPCSLIWLTDRYHKWLEQGYPDFHILAARYGEQSSHYTQIHIPFYDPYTRSWSLTADIKSEEWEKFFATQPSEFRLPVRFDGEYQRYLKQKVGNLKLLNQLSGQNRTELTDYRLSSAKPSNPVEAGWWSDFVRSRLPFSFINMASIAGTFHSWLSDNYKGGIADLNARYGSTYASFQDVPIEGTRPTNTAAAADWSRFLTDALPIDQVRLDTVEQRWSDWLRARYDNDPTKLAKAHGVAPLDFSLAPVPIAEADRLYVREHRSELSWKYLLGNYVTVIEYLLLRSNSFYNTAVLCLAMVLAQLTVNPLCAYALSRFGLNYRFTIILLLIATMAFPHEVQMIPNFLNLKQLGLLNTYWALILPGLVSGYYIFIMKGFFDGLPAELFEAAKLDGATELQMFWHIAMPLAKPIFAVKALAAFTAAYGGFMWAFLVCQDKNLWTIMVHLYNFQQGQPIHLVMAALTIASIPTLIVYLFCQTIIMKGIILPTMK